MNIFSRLLAHPVFHTAVIVAVVLGVLVCIFPHYIPSLSWGVNYAVHIMLLFLLSGLLLLFLRQPRLTFVFFGGCAILCMFLKYSVRSDGLVHFIHTPSKKNIVLPTIPSGESEFKVAHLNLTNAGSLSVVLEAVRAANADLVSVHEVTPDWAGLLKDSLSGQYPFHHTMVDIGIFGMAIYSKYGLVALDTFYYQEIPNLRGCLDKSGEKICFVSVHTEPALNSYSLKRLNDHLGVVSGEVLATGFPVVVIGDFNSVSWSNEIQDFLGQTGLMVSRTGFLPYPFVNTSSLFKIPLDHIFYTGELQCTSFGNLIDKGSNHLGIYGTFGQKLPAYHAKKTAQ